MTASTLSRLDRETIQCGLVTDGYRMPMAVVSRFLLSDVPTHTAPVPTLVVPTARTPFPRVLGRRDGYQPLWLADPLDADLAWQRDQVGAAAIYLTASPSTLPPELTDIELILNPFGLQHTIAEAPRYAGDVRRVAAPDAVLVTLDWGPTRYPNDLAGLPGIADEVRFAHDSQLLAFGEETGWALQREREIVFEMPHTVDHVAALLNEVNAATLRAAAAPDRVVEVGSSVIYRLYRALPG
jgi:hypothetical protein